MPISALLQRRSRAILPSPNSDSELSSPSAQCTTAAFQRYNSGPVGTQPVPPLTLSIALPNLRSQRPGETPRSRPATGRRATARGAVDIDPERDSPTSPPVHNHLPPPGPGSLCGNVDSSHQRWEEDEELLLLPTTAPWLARKKALSRPQSAQQQQQQQMHLQKLQTTNKAAEAKKAGTATTANTCWPSITLQTVSIPSHH